MLSRAEHVSICFSPQPTFASIGITCSVLLIVKMPFNAHQSYDHQPNSPIQPHKSTFRRESRVEHFSSCVLFIFYYRGADMPAGRYAATAERRMSSSVLLSPCNHLKRDLLLSQYSLNLIMDWRCTKAEPPSRL